MGLFKQFADMGKMVQAAPGLIDQAQQLQAQAAQYQQSMDLSVASAASVNGATPQAGNLEPIAGVDLECYARIVKGIAPYGYDESKLVAVAAMNGVDAAAWAEAQAGWAARIQADRGVGRRFNEIYMGA